MTTLGKIIGGGLPVGAYGGKARLMDLVAPAGPVYQAGTLSGNPLAVAAGLKTLEILRRPGIYERLDSLTGKLTNGLMRGSGATGRGFDGEPRRLNVHGLLYPEPRERLRQRQEGGHGGLRTLLPLALGSRASTFRPRNLRRPSFPLPTAKAMWRRRCKLRALPSQDCGPERGPGEAPWGFLGGKKSRRAITSH